MVVSHFPALVLFAFLVSVVFGLLSKDTPRDRFIYGAKVFGAFIGIALLLGWIMVPFPWK
jgi:putative Mn2+ efflux pump MntP